MTLRKLRLAVSTVALAALLAFAVAEPLARRLYGEGFSILVDPYEDHVYRPLARIEQRWGGRTITIHTNSLGWKDGHPGRRVARRFDGRRVVLLGDSFAEGIGLPQDQTVGAALERALAKRGGRVEVLGAGQVSYSPILEYQRLKRFLAAGYEADTLVVMLDVSDVQDELAYGSRYLFSEAGEPLRFRGWTHHPFPRWFYNHSALVRSVRRLMPPYGIGKRPGLASNAGGDSRVEKELAQPHLTREGFLALASPETAMILRPNWMGHPPSLRGWAQNGLSSAFANLDRIRGTALENGMSFVLVIYPWPQMLYNQEDPDRYELLARRFPRWYRQREAIYGRRPSPSTTEYQRAVYRFCRERGVTLVDFIPELQSDPGWPELYIPGDVHFNADGYQRLAERIAAVIPSSGGL